MDWDVAVLRVKGTNGAVRAIVYGYACHGTSVRSGDDWYVVSGEYMAYARQHLEAVPPGAMAIYLAGMGADSDPVPRGRLLDAGEPLPRSVKLPLAVVRLGDGLTFILMGGEVVVDYTRRLERLLAQDHPWPVGYAYEVPCYIPSARLIKEGGYETESSMIYYGFYGPFRGGVEDLLVNRAAALVAGLRTR